MAYIACRFCAQLILESPSCVNLKAALAFICPFCHKLQRVSGLVVSPEQYEIECLIEATKQPPEGGTHAPS